jgi:hypothetical protein
VARVGGWWPRSNTPEIDLIGVDRVPASQVSFVGTIKWREKGIVTSNDIAKLAKDAVAVPGVDAATLLVAVCPDGWISDKRIARTWTAADLLEAWH